MFFDTRVAKATQRGILSFPYQEIDIISYVYLPIYLRPSHPASLIPPHPPPYLPPAPPPPPSLPPSRPPDLLVLLVSPKQPLSLSFAPRSLSLCPLAGASRPPAVTIPPCSRSTNPNCTANPVQFQITTHPDIDSYNSVHDCVS